MDFGLWSRYETGPRGLRGVIFNTKGAVEARTRWHKNESKAADDTRERLLDIAACIEYELRPRAYVNGQRVSCELIRAGEEEKNEVEA